MTTKAYFHELSQNEKRSFYLQEVFGDYYRIKIHLLIIITAMLTFDLLLTSVIANIFDPTYPRSSNARLVLLILAAVTYAIPYINRLQRFVNKLGKYKILIHFVATVLYGVYLFLVNLQYLDAALQTGKHEDWSHAYVALSLSIHIMVLMNLICPAWYLKVIIAGSYYLAMIICFVKNNTDEKNWIVIRCTFSFLYVLALVILTNNFRWSLFVKTNESQAMNQVYTDILNAIPNPIFVIDSNGGIIYNNSEFLALASNGVQSLFNNIVKLKLRESNIPLRSPDQPSTVRFNFNESQPFMSKEEPFSSLGVLSPCRKSVMGLQFNTFNDALNYFKLRMVTDVLDQAQTIFDAKVRLNPANGEEMLSYEVIFRPLIEQKKIIILLNNTTQRDLIASLEDNNEYKDKLLASVSHELRTPLNGNLGFLQAALVQEEVSEAIKEKFLLPALRSGKLLLHLINDILDFSKIQRRKILLNMESKPLKDSLDYCYGLFEHVFKMKNLRFSLKIDPNLRYYVRTDHTRLIQILINLLSNALKFTMRGKVVMSAKGHTDPNYIQIKVADTGIGISQEESTKLFDEFMTSRNEPAGAPVNVSSKGVGLGLKVANRLAKMLGPREGNGIHVRSKNGKGSEFYFILKHQSLEAKSVGSKLFTPKNKLPSINLEDGQVEEGIDSEKTNLSVPEIPLEHTRSKRRGSFLEVPSYYQMGLKKNNSWKRKEIVSEETSANSVLFVKKILIVDDDLFNILALESIIKHTNLQVESANNGCQAIERISNDPTGWGLIFMDCQMPVMDGYEASKQLCQMMERGEIASVPIIGYTAFSAKDKIEECIRSGMKEVIGKPAMIERVREVLEKYLK